MNKKTVAIVLAGGSGSRMKNGTPKQFLELAGEPVILHSLKRFEADDRITGIVVVCREDYIGKLNELLKEKGIKKVRKIVPGGMTRQESSFNGLKNCPPGTDIVLIHDSARPFVDDKIVKRTIDAARQTGASTAVTESRDTIIGIEGGTAVNILSRKKLRRVQTPQGFRFRTIKEAHKYALKQNIRDATDDCALVMAMGRPVKPVKGSESNMKITTLTDLYLAEQLSRGGDRRKK